MLAKHLWRALRLAALIAAPITLSPTQVAAQHEHHQSQKALGKVHFPVSCSQDAQTTFDEGMKLQHSFWYKESERKFQEVLKADPTCVMAHWGRAMSLLYNPFVAPQRRTLPRASLRSKRHNGLALRRSGRLGSSMR